MANISILTQDNKAILINGSAIKSQGGGGDTGHTLYLWHNGITSDDCKILLNDSYDVILNEYISGEYYSHAVLPYNGVTKFKVYNYSHAGDTNWWYKAHTSSTWISGSKGQEITITEDYDLRIFEGTCLDASTMITMADGTKKRISEIQFGDIVLNYKNEPAIVTKAEYGNQAYKDFRDTWKFENGYQVITTGRHEFYNIEHQKMMYMQNWQIGEHAYTENGERVALLEHIHEDIPCHYFSLWCKNDGNNYFANGLLAGNRFTEKIHIK